MFFFFFYYYYFVLFSLLLALWNNLFHTPAVFKMCVGVCVCGMLVFLVWCLCHTIEQSVFCRFSKIYLYTFFELVPFHFTIICLSFQSFHFRSCICSWLILHFSFNCLLLLIKYSIFHYFVWKSIFFSIILLGSFSFFIFVVKVLQEWFGEKKNQCGN